MSCMVSYIRPCPTLDFIFAEIKNSSLKDGRIATYMCKHIIDKSSTLSRTTSPTSIWIQQNISIYKHLANQKPTVYYSINSYIQSDPLKCRFCFGCRENYNSRLRTYVCLYVDYERESNFPWVFYNLNLIPNINS